MHVIITPPYLDPNSHEALYEIDVTAVRVSSHSSSDSAQSSLKETP